LVSGKEQGPSNREPVLLSKIKTLKIQRNERANQKNLKN
jgi:hypothetical protein